MADDQALDGGTGTNPYTAAADDVGGAKYQRVKISVGADGVVGDATPSNPIPVRISDGASAQTPVRVDNQGFTDNASNITPGGYLFDEVAGTALTENDAAAARIDAKRAQILVIEDATTRGQRASVDATGALLVDNAELAAAGALGDTDANPTTTKVGSALMGWTGSVWARLRTSLGDNVASASVVNVQPMVFNSGTVSHDRLYGTALNGAAVDVTRLQLPVQAGTATLANVAASASSVTLQASNTNRKGLVIVNDSTSILYVKFGSAASTTSYTYFMNGSQAGVPTILELPEVVYTGIVTGIWASAVGNARMTELT